MKLKICLAITYCLCSISVRAYDLTLLRNSTSQEIEQHAQSTLAQAQAQLAKLKALPSHERTFENTARAFDIVFEHLQQLGATLELLVATHPDEAIRNAAQASQLKFNDFAIEELEGNKQIYNAIKEYTPANDLTFEQSYFVQGLLNDFKRQGLDLPDEQLEEVKKLQKKISELGLTFDRNINDDASTIEITSDELAGVDSDCINSLEHHDTLVVVPCTRAIYSQIMENCTVESTRKKLYYAYNNRAYPANSLVLNELVQKRLELAHKLGFVDYAHLALCSQMAATPERVQQFLKHLREQSESAYARDHALLIEKLPVGITLSDDNKIKPWDVGFIDNNYKKTHFDIDQEKLAEYFPTETTVPAILELYQNFLGIEFKPVNIDGLIHKDVKTFEVYNNHACIGLLILDLYPRKNKFSHAAQLAVSSCTHRNPESVVVIVTNFPVATQQKPSLLRFDDVETIFHELGHAMHSLLGCTELAVFSGTSVLRDFVETPSQTFEQWAYDTDILKKIGCHYLTGESLSDEVIKKIQKSEKFGFAAFIQRQSFLALFDLALGGENIGDIHSLWQTLRDPIMRHIATEDQTHFEAAFGHLFGYGSKYYSYLWSLVFALELHHKIKQGGLLTPDGGTEFKNKILSKGGSVPPECLIKDFLGKDATTAALLEQLKLA